MCSLLQHEAQRCERPSQAENKTKTNQKKKGVNRDIRPLEKEEIENI